MAKALPSEPVTTVREDNVPKSWTVPLTAISRRIASPRIGLALESRTNTVMEDCDAPSWLMLSGIAVGTTDIASSDGPDRAGASV